MLAAFGFLPAVYPQPRQDPFGGAISLHADDAFFLLALPRGHITMNRMKSDTKPITNP